MHLAALKAWDTIRRRRTEEGYYEWLVEKERKEERARLRNIILSLGGLNDRTYRIPLILRRKNGLGLDEMATELRAFGYTFDDGEDLYRTITSYWG